MGSSEANFGGYSLAALRCLVTPLQTQDWAWLHYPTD